MMRARGAYAGAVMTVFFALLSVFFLGLFFLVIESVRYQGLRAHAAQITDMGNYSVFGEFEKKLLTDFELFAVDGAYGTGDYSTERAAARLGSFVQLNTRPSSSGLKMLCFDPWQLNFSGAKITGHTLLSDGGGEALYQEALAYMHKTAIMTVTGKLLDLYRDAEDAQEKQKTYEQEKLSADREMKELEEQEAQKKKELEEQAKAGDGGDGQSAEPETESSGKKIRNPIPALRRLARKDILSIVCPDKEISGGSVGKSELCSKRKANKGNMPVARKYGGLVDNLIFREYLLDHLVCFTDEPKGGKLSYELEYLLGGKLTDRKNLKSVVTGLLLVREGFNYLYCTTDSVMYGETGAAAAFLIGWTGIPALVAIMQHALLLGWAYAESLMDVRGLMGGGRVPLLKTPETWKISLENLADIVELLEGGGNKWKKGLNYRGYLRLLMNIQGIGEQKKRALDLVELRVSSTAGLSGFKADQCLVAIKDEVSFQASPLFSKVTGVFMGLAGSSWQDTVQGGFSYLEM